MRIQKYAPIHKNETEIMRDLEKKLKILVVALIFLFGIGTFGFMILAGVSFIEGFTMTIETLVFARDISEDGILRMLDIALLFFGVFATWWILWGLFDLILEGAIGKLISNIKFFRSIKKMESHFIVCGGGRVGEYVGEMLKEKKKKYVILEKDEDTVNALRKKGQPAIVADAMDEDALRENGIMKAAALIVVLPETEKNILITLTARELVPHLVIYSRAHKKSLMSRLKEAGANYVIIPEIAGAEKIIQQIFK